MSDRPEVLSLLRELHALMRGHSPILALDRVAWLQEIERVCPEVAP
ncbi:MAG: hypothetical protein ACREB9_03915 [Thermoplasmata archaeon]